MTVKNWIERKITMKAEENDLVREVIINTNEDIIPWKQVDPWENRFESSDEKFPFVVEKQGTVPVLLTGGGIFESLLSRSLLVNDLLKAIERQLERQGLDLELSSLIAEYMKP